MRLGNLKALKPRVFKFKKGQGWDGDEAIFDYIEGLLIKWNKGEAFPRVKRDTYITILCAIKLEKDKSKNGRSKKM